MDVNEAIIRFKNGCCLPTSRMSRMIAVKIQNQSNVFEVKDTLGLVRIFNYGTEAKIVAYLDNYAKRGVKPFESLIDDDVYLELEKLYKYGI